MNIRIYSLKRAGQTNRSSQWEGYLAEQCKMLGGTVKSLVFSYQVKSKLKENMKFHDMSTKKSNKIQIF